MTTADDLGTRIAKRRKDLGLSQSELADLAHTSVRSVHAVEHGKLTTRLDVIVAISSALGLRLVLSERE
jgi:ribosome-binding protein aMBF1 (putative translation factor)